MRRSFSTLVLPFVLAYHQNSKGCNLLRNEVLCIFNFGNAKNALHEIRYLEKRPCILF